METDAKKASPLPTLMNPTFAPWKAEHEKSVAVLMSGGVDSSVTALLLRDAGWDVVGITMKIPLAESCSAPRPCCGVDAGLVCRDLGLPHYFVDTVDAFTALVVSPFRESYRQGQTPSPCVDCNTFLKFGAVWQVVEAELGVRHLATGHYAQVLKDESGTYLARAKDAARDQSYFLYGIPRERLPYLHLPLADLPKSQVRELAGSNGLGVASKPDSMEICFAGEGDYKQALSDLEKINGPILTTAGKQIGEHKGLHHYTVGQRQGLGVSSNQRLYVVEISAETNSITVGTYKEALTQYVRAENLNVLIPGALREGRRFWGRIRSKGEPVRCVVIDMKENQLAVWFEDAVFGSAPGQHLVLYDDQERVVAGGVIQRSERALQHSWKMGI